MEAKRYIKRVKKSRLNKDIFRDKEVVFLVNIEGVMHAVNFLFNWGSKRARIAFHYVGRSGETIGVYCAIDDTRGPRMKIEDLKIASIEATVDDGDGWHVGTVFVAAQEPRNSEHNLTYNKDMHFVKLRNLKGSNTKIIQAVSSWLPNEK